MEVFLAEKIINNFFAMKKIIAKSRMGFLQKKNEEIIKKLENIQKFNEKKLILKENQEECEKLTKKYYNIINALEKQEFFKKKEKEKFHFDIAKTSMIENKEFENLKEYIKKVKEEKKTIKRLNRPKSFNIYQTKTKITQHKYHPSSKIFYQKENKFAWDEKEEKSFL